MPILIKNGTLVNEDEMIQADVLIDGDKIVAVGKNLSFPEGCQILDATDRLLIPGGIDTHTHFQMPYNGQVTADDFYTGTASALAGGTTMIMDFVVPSVDSAIMPIDAFKLWRSWADPKVCCDFAFTVAITSWSSEVARQMEILTQDYGVNAFKFYLAYAGTLMVSDETLYKGLKLCSRIGALARVHAENGEVIAEKEKEVLEMGIRGPEGHTQSRPEELEAEATNRAATLAEQANCPLYVVHVMTKGAADVVAKFKRKGAVIFGEPIAAGLALDGSHYYNKDFQHAAGFVMSPPLSRDTSTAESLMDRLAAGELHVTGTDNCTYNCCQKAAGKDDFTKIPNGINGVEDRLSIIWEKGVVTGKMDPMRFVQVTSSTAAKIFNIYPKKGRIAVRSDADVVIWNPNADKVISKETHHQAVDFNVFEGIRVTGVAETTICKGKIVWHDGKLDVVAGSGRFVPLRPFCPYAYATIPNKAKAMAPRRVDREEKMKNGCTKL